MAVDPAVVWTRGDYPAVARLFEPAAVELVRAVGVAGTHVLDVAAGTGTVAAAAVTGGAAAVTLLDACPPLLARARARLAGGPVPVRAAVGDLHRLPAADGGAARVVSSFGVVYADDPATAARELVRACAPGGRIGLTAFTPGSAPGCFRAVLAALLDGPLPDRSRAVPAAWADPDRLRAFFAGTGAELLSVTDHTMPLRFPGPAEAARFFAAKSGPILEVRDHLEAQGHWPAAERELTAAFARAGRRDGDAFTVPAPYRLALLCRPGAP
jgi:SAM-dependent methyltransferase